jgi:hypothetical protein
MTDPAHRDAMEVGDQPAKSTPGYYTDAEGKRLAEIGDRVALAVPLSTVPTPSPEAVARVALEWAAEKARDTAKSYTVLKDDRETYEPPRIQQAARSMVRLAAEDIDAAASDPATIAAIVAKAQEGGE